MGRPIRDRDVHEGTTHLLRELGARVRKMRTDLGLSRRIVSESSGVSPRYLAQLEAGEGNISIALLDRVAHALNCDLTRFLPRPEQDDLTRAFDAADAETKAQVMALLKPKATSGRICLIGLRGAGKSTLGKELGAQLNLPFVELNDEIAALGSMPVAEIMALYGPDGYRRLEAEALERVIARHDRMVLAVAGGIVEEQDTFDTLLSAFRTVWLKASPQEHMDRVLAQGDMRPMAGNPQAMGQLKSILSGREALYGRADMQLDTSGDTLDASLSKLMETLQKNGVEPRA